MPKVPSNGSISKLVKSLWALSFLPKVTNLLSFWVTSAPMRSAVSSLMALVLAPLSMRAYVRQLSMSVLSLTGTIGLMVCCPAYAADSHLVSGTSSSFVSTSLWKAVWWLPPHTPQLTTSWQCMAMCPRVRHL